LSFLPPDLSKLECCDVVNVKPVAAERLAMDVIGARACRTSTATVSCGTASVTVMSMTATATVTMRPMPVRAMTMMAMPTATATATASPQRCGLSFLGQLRLVGS